MRVGCCERRDADDAQGSSDSRRRRRRSSRSLLYCAADERDGSSSPRDERAANCAKRTFRIYSIEISYHFHSNLYFPSASFTPTLSGFAFIYSAAQLYGYFDAINRGYLLNEQTSDSRAVSQHVSCFSSCTRNKKCAKTLFFV